ncbi:helix-turn-helix transcriptional regulator [Acidisoma sp. 7E03]
MDALVTPDNRLGVYLKGRRSKLDPAALGFPVGRRRTQGLRREEVAQRAGISATWYTWLEQGRGGAPSAEALDRIAHALLMTEVEREHLFLLGLGRLPEVRFRGATGVTPRLQRLIDTLEYAPALVKTATWDIVAWNRAAAIVLTDYGALPPEARNILRMIFIDPKVRAHQIDWEGVARFVVGAFRAEMARAGAEAEAAPLIAELSERSPEFAAMWRANDVHDHGEGVKRLKHPALGTITFEYSAFAVDGRPDLGLVIYNPATAEDLARARSFIQAAEAGAGDTRPTATEQPAA